jgi:hypothetical protein
MESELTTHCVLGGGGGGVTEVLLLPLLHASSAPETPMPSVMSGSAARGRVRRVNADAERERAVDIDRSPG